MARHDTDELVTVFGGSGFIGRYLVRRLARRGVRVKVAVRRPDEALFVKPYGGVGQIEPVQANIRDDASVARAVAGATRVVNLVGILYQGGKQTFEAVQDAGAGRVARAAAAAGARSFVQLSAIGADAESPSAYARSKAAGEAAVTAAFPSATILRPSVVFGPEDQFFNLFGRMGQMLPILPMIGGGETRLQPVYVDDVAAAIEIALFDPAQAGRTFELGGPRVMTMEEAMAFVLSVSGRKRVLLPFPAAPAKFLATFLQLLPVPPLTVDQVRLLEIDNVARGPGLSDLGITPTPVEAVGESYLYRYRDEGLKVAVGG